MEWNSIELNSIWRNAYRWQFLLVSLALPYETINRVANCEAKYVFFFCLHSECDACGTRLKIKIQSKHFDGIQHIINSLVLSTKAFGEATRTAIFWSFCSRPQIARIKKRKGEKMIKSSSGGGSWMKFYFSNDWMPLNVAKRPPKIIFAFVCSLRMKHDEGRTGSLCSTYTPIASCRCLGISN